MRKILPFILLLYIHTIAVAQDINIDTAFIMLGSGPPQVSTDNYGNTYVVQADDDFFVVDKFDSLNHLVWSRTVNSNLAIANAIVADSIGNTIIGGYALAIDSIDFDSGPDTAYFINTGSSYADPFIMKLDPEGNILWLASLNGNVGPDELQDISIDKNGNIYAVGLISGLVDFDPGPGIYNAGISGFNSFFIAKYNSLGNIIWAKSIGTDDIPSPVSYDDDHDDWSIGVDNATLDVVVSGHFTGTKDFNPGSGVNNLISAGGTDAFVLKLNSSGNFVWAKRIGGTGTDYVSKIVVDDEENIYTGGGFQNTVDFDPSSSSYMLTSSGGISDVFLLKLNSFGNFVWAKSFGGINQDQVLSAVTDSSCNIYITGNFKGIVDFDPGLGFANDTSTETNVFITKLSKTGNFIWSQHFLSSSLCSGEAIALDNDKNIISVGSMSGLTDFDPGLGVFNIPNSSGYPRTYYFKAKQDLCSNFAILVDSVADLNCTSNGMAAAYSTGGSGLYSYLWNTTPSSTDSIISFDTIGIYHLTATDMASGCVRSTSLLINGPSTTSDYDLNINLLATSFRPGFNSTIWLDGINAGCVPVTGNISLILPSLVNYNSALPIPDLISGDTLLWNFTALTYDSIHITPQINLTTSTSALIGDSIRFDLFITPVSGDVDISNNQKTYFFPIINGYDPNEKQVYPQGVCEDHLVMVGQKMTYAIRFQNTGNSEAINISIIDSLDSNLNLNTVRVVGSSHYVTKEILPSNTLKFYFNDIHLLDSTSNEPESHGYIIYEADQLPGLPTGTVLKNNAHIYFDFNPAVTTNIIKNKLSTTLNCFSGLNEAECNYKKVRAYPNPTNGEINIITSPNEIAKELSVFDIYGRAVVPVFCPSTNTSIINLCLLAEGIYFIKVSFEDIYTIIRVEKF